MNFIYQSGIPYKIDLKKNIKHNIIKEKINPNLENEKIEFGPINVFNLDDNYTKEELAKHKLNIKNEEHLLRSQNFKTRKSCIPQDISVFAAKSFLKSMNIIKNTTKSRLFDFEKKYSHKISEPIETEKNVRKKSVVLYNSFLKMNSQKLNSPKSMNLTNEYNKSNNLRINAESQKLINLDKLYIKELLNNERKNISIESNLTKRNTSRKMSKTVSKTVYKTESKKVIKKLKPNKNLKILLLESNNRRNNKIDKNYKNFKLSIKDLVKYNKRNYNINTIENYISNNYTKEEKINLEKKNFEKISKNLGYINNKIRKVINNYDILMNKRSLTERNKEDNLKITKMFSSLGKKTINNMATDLGFCQKHIKDQLLNLIEEDFSFKKSEDKLLDPLLEIILDKKIKKEINNQSEYKVPEDYDFIKDRHIKEYQKKEINRLGELIGKINNKLAFDLSSYLILYNKNMGNRIEGIENKKQRKERINNIKYLKNSIENKIHLLKKRKQKNIFEYNKIVNNFNDYYTKIENEKKLNMEYRKLFFTDK